MKILHILAEISAESGVAIVATRLAVEQQGLGCEVSVASTEEREVLKLGEREGVAVGSNSRQLEERNVEHSTSNIEHRTGVRVVTFRRNWPHFLYFSWGMLLGLGKMVKDVDVVHVHSNWTFPVWWGAWLALRQKKTLVMSPHGCFDPVRLKHSGWKKALVGWIDRWLLRRASVVHATCEVEAGWIQPVLKFEPTSLAATPSQGAGFAGSYAEPESSKVLKLRGPKIVVIPNGVEKCDSSLVR